MNMLNPTNNTPRQGYSGVPDRRQRKDGLTNVWRKFNKQIRNDEDLQDRLAQVLVDKLEKGYWPAWQDLLDRALGKPGQTLTVNANVTSNPLDGLIGQALVDAAREILLGNIGTVPQVAQIVDAIDVESSVIPSHTTLPSETRAQGEILSEARDGTTRDSMTGEGGDESEGEG